MRILEGLLISLMLTITLAELAMLRKRVPPQSELGVADCVLPWLDSVGILKKCVYTRDYRTLNETLQAILQAPFRLIAMNLEGREVMHIEYGEINVARAYAYLLPGFNGTRDPLVVVLVVNGYE